MSEQFAVIDVSAWQESHGEVMGSKPKVWLVSPAGEHWLFKQARDSSDQAEDWSEKVAAELAKALNVPAATVELATNHGRRGVISRNVAPGFDLVHGNELLYRRDPAYERDLPRPARGYTLSAVKAVLGDCPPPPGWHRPDWTAYDVFAGYLMFDAFIANQDRHHENWAVLVNRITGDRELSPSFDHASSLGFLLTDADRSGRLETRDRGYSVQQWASRGRATSRAGRRSLGWRRRRSARVRPQLPHGGPGSCPDSGRSDGNRSWRRFQDRESHTPRVDLQVRC